MRTIVPTRYVAPLREGGSLPGLVEADDDGLYVLKFRGAGQGAGRRAAFHRILSGRVSESGIFVTEAQSARARLV